MSRPNTIFFIHNPHAARGVTAGRVREFRSTQGAEYDWAETTGPQHATELARQAALDVAEIVVAVGGDGTVHEVINGLMSVPESARPKFGILPVGSGDDFAFAARIPHDFEKAIAILLAGNSTSVDIGWVEDNRGKKEYWNNTIGIGFDARVTVRSRKHNVLHGVPMYFAATLATLLRDHHHIDIELTLDSLRFSERVLMLTLANGPREGGGFYTTPHSKISDGIFEMLLVKPLSRLQMLMLLPKVLKGTHLTSSSVFHHPFESLELIAKQPLVIHADGEIIAVPEDNVVKITVGMLRNALRVVS